MCIRDRVMLHFPATSKNSFSIVSPAMAHIILFTSNFYFSFKWLYYTISFMAILAPWLVSSFTLHTGLISKGLFRRFSCNPNHYFLECHLYTAMLPLQNILNCIQIEKIFNYIIPFFLEFLMQKECYIIRMLYYI